METPLKREAAWSETLETIEQELEKVRKRALVSTSLEEIEEVVVQSGHLIQQALLSGAAQQQTPESRHIKCASCGAKMMSKGVKGRQLKTSVGKVAIERERWACPDCGTSVFPP